MDGRAYCCTCYQDEEDDEQDRRDNTTRLISKYKSSRIESDQLLDTVQVLIRIYTQKPNATSLLKRCRLNPSYQQVLRNDLEYFAPQLINYLVFHENMSNKSMLKFVGRASQSDFFFAHLVYFQLRSVSEIVHAKGSLKINTVNDFLNEFTREMSEVYADKFLIAAHLIEEIIERERYMSYDQSQSTMQVLKKTQNMTQSVYKAQMKSEAVEQSHKETIMEYGTTYYTAQGLELRAQDIHLKNYCSIFGGDGAEGFRSTIDFWQDLITISERLHLANPKIISLRADVQRINERLPAAVYVPFVKDELRNYVLLNIVGGESRVFSTKMRSPFSLCLELYRPDVEQDIENAAIELSVPQTVQSAKVKRSSSLCQEWQCEEVKQAEETLNNLTQDQEVGGISIFYKQEQSADEIDATTAINCRNSSSFVHNLEVLATERNFQISKEELMALHEICFGESAASQRDRIRANSPFRKMKSWRLVNIIVKTDDNLKQEQFALQLISQFDQIFRVAGLPLRITNYEVLSLGPACGIIEMVKDATTIDSLKKTLFNHRRELHNFSTFFATYFQHNYQEALTNYMNSLAAYCLVTYFLQVKDRHNGNILLLTDGSLMHIDFGFFLSNAPGKGIEFERKVPFKLLSEYIEVLGGVDSKAFDQFRKLFYRGFQVCQQNQDKILILVKMMYSGHGTTLPCFKRGSQCLRDLEARFNPPCTNDMELYVFTQQLIDSSLDNWRARWYDKYQYYVQGIFY